MGRRPTVAVLMGVPGAGKSTFVRARLAEGPLHLSKDFWPHARRKEARLLRLLSQALGEGRDVVVDNTHVSRRARAGVLACARAHGARVEGYFFAARLRDCLARNAGRTGRARLPEEAVCILASQLQAPRLAEGFDVLWRVAVLPQGGFRVTPWAEGPQEEATPAAPG